MKKAEYLQLLKKYLSGKIKDDELKDILSDYEGFFLTGIEEGKTEEEISAELGDPIEIAHSLIEEENKQLSICYAPVYKRILALIIDIIVAGLPFIWLIPRTAIDLYFRPQMLFNMVPTFLSTVNISSHQWISRIQPFWSIAIIASVFWFFLINPLCMFIFKGYTIGKRIMKIRVVSVNGENANFVQLIVREWIGKYLINTLGSMLGSILPSILEILPSIISLIWASVSKKHYTIHDTIAHTCVVECPGKR